MRKDTDPVRVSRAPSEQNGVGLSRIRGTSRIALRSALGLAVALGALIFPGSAFGQSPSFGPLSTEEGGPLQRISYTALTESADPVAPGSIRGDIWVGFSNVFEQDSSATHWLFMDMERLITATTVRVGVTDRFELGGRATFETTGGGVLDSFVSWWHTSLSLGNANRERYPASTPVLRESQLNVI